MPKGAAKGLTSKTSVVQSISWRHTFQKPWFKLVPVWFCRPDFANWRWPINASVFLFGLEGLLFVVVDNGAIACQSLTVKRDRWMQSFNAAKHGQKSRHRGRIRNAYGGTLHAFSGAGHLPSHSSFLSHVTQLDNDATIWVTPVANLFTFAKTPLNATFRCF